MARGPAQAVRLGFLSLLLAAHGFRLRGLLLDGKRPPRADQPVVDLQPGGLTEVADAQVGDDRRGQSEVGEVGIGRVRRGGGLRLRRKRLRRNDKGRRGREHD
mgnify:CR=1 FL=1